MDKSAIIKALRDGAQATSNGIADGVLGYPVDGMASLLSAVGIDSGKAPVGGTEWLKQTGITRPTDDSLASQLGYAAGVVPTSMLQVPQFAGPMTSAAKALLK